MCGWPVALGVNRVDCLLEEEEEEATFRVIDCRRVNNLGVGVMYDDINL